MTIAGVWHGSTWNFVVFGVLNGLGVSAAKLWENIILKWAGRPGLRSYLQSANIRRVAIVANFHFVCLTFFFFPGDLNYSFSLLLAAVGGGTGP